MRAFEDDSMTSIVIVEKTPAITKSQGSLRKIPTDQKNNL